MFNVYAWFWIVREIFWRIGTDWENYVLWFCTTAGKHYFVFFGKDIWVYGKASFERRRET